MALDKKTRFHLRLEGDTWVLTKEEGARPVAGPWSTRADALRDARHIARQEAPSELHVHGVDGATTEERTYRREPEPPLRS